MLHKRKTAPGRYDLARAHEPANGRGLPPRSANAFTAVVAVPDPHQNPEGPGNERTLATVNRRVDILELEKSHGRISDAAYSVGRIVQAVFERAKGPGGTNWQGGSRVDAWAAHELAIIHGIEDARRITGWIERITRALGMIDARILRRVLGDRMNYAEVAAATGKAGERGTAYIAQRFRDALEELAEALAAKGRPI